MRNAGLGSWPERRLRISPERDALWFDGKTTSYRDLALRVRRLAGALSALGVGAGDRVAWLGYNHPCALESLYACGQLGAIWVPLNARSTAPEAAYMIDHCAATVVLHGRNQGELADELRDRTAVRHWITAEPPVSGGRSSVPYEDLLATATPDERDTAVSLDDVCLIMYTSGTTGRPKGATLTHGNMTFACINQVLGFDIAGDERTLAMAPLFHIGGLNSTVNPVVLRGGCSVIMRGFDPHEALRLIEDQRINSFFGVPTMLDAMARSPQFHTRDLSSLRTIVAAGAPVPQDTLRNWLDRGVTVQQAYGMTESAPSGTVLDADVAVAKVGSAGKPQFFTDVRVVAEDGRECAPGELGEVVLSGPNIMPGYWEDPERTAEVLVEGWYRSGDIGVVDEQGYLYIRDRFKDMIISGGENIYPAEVESALREIPGVLDAAVIGVPDDTWGEVGLAVVVTEPTTPRHADHLHSVLRTRLAAFKIPKHFRFVDELPKTPTGKVRKPDLRKHYREDTP
ncbi:acyl-CoA synthetase [Mycolicibacterium sp. CBM1]